MQMATSPFAPLTQGMGISNPFTGALLRPPSSRLTMVLAVSSGTRNVFELRAVDSSSCQITGPGCGEHAGTKAGCGTSPKSEFGSRDQPQHPPAAPGSVSSAGADFMTSRLTSLSRAAVALLAGVTLFSSPPSALAEHVHSTALIAQIPSAVNQSAVLSRSSLDSTKDALSFKFYVHLQIGGPGASEIPVAAPGGDLSSFRFGTVLAVDDVITVGPDPASTPIGRARGIAVNTDEATGTNNSSLFLTFTINTGDVKGSLIVGGTTNKVQPDREVAVLAGTEDFRLAQGVAIQSPVSASSNSDGEFLSTNKWTIVLQRDSLHFDRLRLGLSELLLQ